MTNGPRIAVVGASGAVGEAMLEMLAARKHPAANVKALASERSAGQSVEYGNSQLTLGDLADFDFSGIDYALFSAGAQVSKIHVPRAAGAGAIVIDNTSAFRYDDDVPLVIPEVNAERLENIGPRGVVANPNCSTIQLLMALAPIHAAAGVARVSVATYQSVSGAGRAGLNELARQTAARLSFHDPEMKAFTQPIAFNVLPQIDELLENGYSREEMKILWETRKILDDPEIGVSATAVRVPVFYGHAEAVQLETRGDIEIEAVRDLLRAAPGLTLFESDTVEHPTPVTHAAGKDDVFVGRLRRDLSHPKGICMWIVCDNIRKGAALNSVQIMDRLEARRAGVEKTAPTASAKVRTKEGLEA